MNVNLADKLYEFLKHKKLDEAIALAEQELQEIPPTGFHKILGNNLLHQASALATYIKEFDKSTKAVLKKEHCYVCEVSCRDFDC